MKNVTIGFPEFLLAGGIALCITTPGTLAISITSLSILAAIGRASLDIQKTTREQERADAEEARKIKSEERVDKIIEQLATTNQLHAATNINNFLSGRYDGGDNNGGNNGGFSH